MDTVDYPISAIHIISIPLWCKVTNVRIEDKRWHIINIFAAESIGSVID